MNEYKYERIAPNILHDIQWLYKKAFNKKVSLASIKQKYNTVLFGKAYIGYLAYCLKTNEPAAYYGVFPIKGILNNSEYIIAQSGDTMTNPNHRGKGLFIILAKMTYELAKKEGIDFIFGFPNKNSYPGFINKLEWKHYNNLNNYSFKGSKLPLEKAAKKANLFNFFYRKYLHKTLKKHTHPSYVFENSIHFQAPQKGYIPHNSNFFQYKKYFDSYLIKLEDIKCWIKIDGQLWVGDIDFCDKNTFLKTVQLLIKLAKKVYCSQITFTQFQGSIYDGYLKEIREVNSQIAIGYRNIQNNIDPELFEYSAVDLDTF